MQQNFTTFDLGFIQAKINQNYYWIRPDKKVKHRTSVIPDSEFEKIKEQCKSLNIKL